MRTGLRPASSVVILATLGACGGGGGGGAANPSAIEVPLTSFAVIAPNQTVVMEGTSAAMTGTATESAGATTITSAVRNPIDSATVKFSYDSTRALSAISVTTPQASFSFDRNTPGHSVSCSGRGTCRAENATTDVLAIDPFVTGWNYQSFGVWGTVDLVGPNWQLGAVSAGNPTSGGSLPTTGTATFTGLASGIYIDLLGKLNATVAGMSAAVNFGSRTIQLSTSNTTFGTSNTGTRTDNGLNLSGTLSYTQGVNSFSGPVQTQNMLLSGQGAGRFYGPAAEEIGGVYSLQGTGVSRMIGGFGGKR
jgi:hypothetical protein